MFLLQIVGPMANATRDVLGDYAANAPDDAFVTVLQGLGSFTAGVQYASGCDNPVCQNYDRDSVLKAINNTNVTFVVLGTGETCLRTQTCSFTRPLFSLLSFKTDQLFILLVKKGSCSTKVSNTVVVVVVVVVSAARAGSVQ